MMHRCNGHGSSSSSYGPCSCNSSSSNFSMLFHNYDQTAEMSSYYSSSVDCTLSLGTPSTRSNNNVDYNYNTSHEKRRSSSSSNCMSNFCWDILQSNKHSNSSHKTGRGSSNSGGNGGGGGETLLARRCANCDTTSTPLWRNGPKGPKSLCNACGIRFKKEERRATAAAATTNGGGNGGGVDGQHMLNSSSSWINHHHHHHQKVPYISAAPYNGNEFRFIDHEDDRDSADNNGISFLSWRLNVTDRPAGLVHEFTR